jgi:nucleoid-associated protein YgaU
MKTFKQFLIESPAPPNIPEIEDYIWKEETQGNENIIHRVHSPQKDDKTVGGGHSFKNLDHSRQVFSQVFPEKMKKNPQWVDELSQGKGSLTPEETKKLFKYDVGVRVDQTSKLIKNFNDLSPEMQKVLVSSVYRGSLGGSPETVKLINAGEYEKAGDEYINNEEYRASKERRSHEKTKIVPGKGVYQRMDREREVMMGERKRQEQMRQPSNNTTVFSDTKISDPGMEGTAYPVTKAYIEIGKTTNNILANKPEQKETEYTIQKGDTLTKIAGNNPEKLKTIIGTNNIKDPNKIQVGQKIKIPK